MKNIFNVSILNYILFIILILSGYINYLIIYLVIIIVHEIGHILVIKILGYKINHIKLSIFGGIIDTNINLNIKSFHLFLISIAGVVFQLILFIIFPKNISNYNYLLFYKLNKTLIIYNLLPIFPLDGYKMLLSITERFIPYSKTIKISYFLSIISIVILFFYIDNIIIIFLLLSYNLKNIVLYKYYYQKFLLERYLYNVEKRGFISVKNINNMYKNKINYINSYNEKCVLENMFTHK